MSKKNSQGGNIDPKLKDFRNFLFLAWKAVIPGAPAPTKLQYDIADFLQGQHKNIMIKAFRGVGKTYITAAFAMWKLMMNPQLKIVIVSSSADFAYKISQFCAQMMEAIPAVKHLKPREDQRSSWTSFDVGPALPAKDPSVYATGINGQLTGCRADIVIADDIETSTTSETAFQREQLKEKIQELNFILTKTGRIIYLGTPHSQDSIYNVLPERDFLVRTWPAEVPEPEARPLYDGNLSNYMVDYLASHAPGTPTEYERFSKEDLLERLVGTSKAKYKLQMMLDTTASDDDAFPLKLRDLIVMDIDKDKAPEKLVWTNDQRMAIDVTVLPKMGLFGDCWYKVWQTVGSWLEYNGAVMAIDPSGRGKDETGYAVVKELNGYLYVTACGGFQGGYDEPTLEGLAKIAYDHKVNTVLIENNFGDGIFTSLFKPVLYRFHKTSIEEVRSSKMKDQRIIETLEPVIQMHRLVVSPELIRRDVATVQKYDESRRAHYQLFHQMTRICNTRGSLLHYDRLDALAMAVSYWKERVSISADDMIRKRKQREYEKFIKSFDKQMGKKDNNSPIRFYDKKDFKRITD